MSTGSTIIIAVATLLGLFFGYATDQGLLGAVVVGALAFAGAYISVTRDSHTAETSGTTRDLWSLFASSDGVYAVGESGTILKR